MADLKFDWRLGDFGLRAAPQKLARVTGDEPNETIDLVKYYWREGQEYCYSIGYFKWNGKEPCWDLKFVGDRFAEIPDDQIVLIWKMLRAAYDVLTDWKSRTADEPEEATITANGEPWVTVVVPRGG